MAATVAVQNFGGVGGLSGILKDVSPDERAAILKARFAETIAKAIPGNPSEAKKEYEEKKVLERRRRLGEAKIKALKRKEEIKKEGKLKRNREEEREAARKALEMVEKQAEAEVEDNLQVMEEFDLLIRGFQYDPENGRLKKPELETSS